MPADTLAPLHDLVRSLLRGPWLWIAFTVGLITSPALFLSSLVVGVVALAAGTWLWSVRDQTALLAVGVGLVLGALPYSLAALRTMLVG